jgi:hypothetical protein
MGIYDLINEPTKKSAVEAIAKDHGFPLDRVPARYLKARKERLQPFLTF